MNLLAAAIAPNAPRFSSAVQRVNHPIHQGRPNPVHGMFFIVGTIPLPCWDETRNNGRGGSRFYPTEQAAIDALIDAGAAVIQGADCRIIRPQ